MLLQLPLASAEGSARLLRLQAGEPKLRVISLTILEGSSVQGNPAYDPDPLTVSAGDVVEVSNEDTVPHTVQVVPGQRMLNQEVSLTQAL